ncbi:MAG TPA: ribonuclease III [Bacillota bacterium]|jgi:ribonuclease-3|nr:ribonuclease III [Bacillota bacterium]HOA35699.1 ribonuclease III [Bacillota bacterium]HOJ83653.1 ribonuclease III [Bacillota bacterium]HOL15466.1 ribonuclease III [Bacillota bacterium]HPZ11620.1 ribonuclease III [Bacillota bacterium]
MLVNNAKEQALSWSDRVKEFLKTLGWEFGDSKLYEQALTHSSFAHEKGKANAHNERLEFLGDAVLQLVISDHLYFLYPHLPEGKLTRLRAQLVCEATLADLAEKLGLGSYLRLGKGEAAGGGAGRPSLLSDALEALFGALFIDRGLEKCRLYIIRLYRPALDKLAVGVLSRDYKTLLQELIQARDGVTPEYRIVRESGPDHDKVFEAEVLVGGRGGVGRGCGRSKKEAEQAAAKEAWLRLN